MNYKARVALASAAILSVHANQIDLETLSINITSFVDAPISTENFNQIRVLKEDLAEILAEENQDVLTTIKSDKPLRGTQLTKLHMLVSNYLKLQKTIYRYQQEEILETSLVAALDRIELFDKAYSSPYKNKKFRRLVNDADRSYNIKKQQVNKSFNKLLGRKNIYNVIDKYNEFANSYRADKSSYTQAFVNQVKSHPALPLIKNYQELFKLRNKYFRRETRDIFTDLKDEVVHQLSGVFGNGVGAIRWRKGWLLERPEILKEIYNELQPLDIITEKTYFAATDTFIPGHFGHNAIWLGTKEQLIDMGMWLHPSIVKYHAEIENGMSIIETDRKGTHLKSLEEFMNVDEFAILRLKQDYFTQETIEDVYDVALSQMGKTYDFNFDVETTDQLVCSELLYQSFGDIDWPTESYVGRTTISPDNVASLALFEDSPVELVYYVAEKKKGQLKYKTIDDLANDINFVKKGDAYFKKEEVCNREWDGTYRTTPGSKIGRRNYIKTCETNFSVLKYE